MSNKQNDEIMEMMKESADEIKEVKTSDSQYPPVAALPQDKNIMFTHIDAYYKGFHTEFVLPTESGKIPAGKVCLAIEDLISRGYEPSWNKETSNAQLRPQTAVVGQPTNPQAPVCGVHGTVMEWKTGNSKKTGKPYAFWSCPTKNADGSYCRYQPEK